MRLGGRVMKRKTVISAVLLLIITFVFAQSFNVKTIRKDLEERDFRKLVIAGQELSKIFEGRHEIMVTYVEPKGIIVTVDLWGGYSYKGINEENLNLFFSSLWRVFGYGISKYPPNIKVNFYIQIESTDESLIVEFPIGALSDLYKEKITRSEFLKQCGNMDKRRKSYS